MSETNLPYVRKICHYCGNPLNIIEFDEKIYATCFTERCPMNGKSIVYHSDIINLFG